jgi:hypothetical protein
MGIFDRFRKPEIAVGEAGKRLAAAASGTAREFLADSIPHIIQDLEFDQTKYSEDVLRGQVLCVCFWAAEKALENDSAGLRQQMVDVFFESVGADRRPDLKEYYRFASKDYGDSWDETTGGNQAILALRILSHFFTEGKNDPRLFGALASYAVHELVFKTMTNVLNCRKSFVLSNN